jgi:threonylcarbamoyladenosine tRNA methylthiotransferase MtaB
MVIGQARQLECAGYKELVLSGINLGSYGRDLDRRISFLSLLERLLSETGILRIRISSIEPMDVSGELIRLVAGEARLADHFHLPLQSGSDRILRLMNRRYWARQYAERLLAIGEAFPNAAIGADVMVGFPGETDRDHATSARFIESLPFTYLHIFPFSARPGTPAAAQPQQINGRVAHERSRELRAIVARKRHAFLQAQVGRTLEALTLDELHDGARVSVTSNYLKVLLPGSPIAPNVLIPVTVVRAQDDELIGSPAAQLNACDAVS